MKTHLNKWKKLTTKQKAVVIGLALFVLGGIGNLLDSSSSNTSKNPQTEVAEVKQISYEIVKRWDVPNGGEGKVIVIPREYLNEGDMRLLGEKLKEDTKRDRNAFIFIFTDRKAAEMRDDDVDPKTLSGEEWNFFVTNFIATYTKNGNSGFHELTIYYDGFEGSNNLTVKY